MSLTRRLLLYLSICAPLVWSVGLLITIGRARHEINELYDTELLRLARQVQATLPATDAGLRMVVPPMPAPGSNGAGQADPRDLAIAVWDHTGRVTMSDREGGQLRYRPDAAGFVNESIEGQMWRILYLQSSSGKWLIAAGQRIGERAELVWGLTITQLIPWLFVLPVLLLTMAWAVRRALLPLYHLAGELGARRASDLHPLADRRYPRNCSPLCRQ
jgi:two-component system sensor histidine kinase QseC